MLRKINILLIIGMFITFLLHAVFGSLQIMGIGNTSLKICAWILVGFITLHVIVSTILTVKTFIAIKKSGASYFGKNKIFWVRRFSGLLIVFCMIFHIVIFIQKNSEAYRLTNFDTFVLINHILLVLTIALHVISNVKPMIISLGIKSIKEFSIDILFVLCFVLLFIIIAFIIYYIRWQAI